MMEEQPVNKKEQRIARWSIAIIFLALIRCIGETFRLDYVSASPPSFTQLIPFLAGAMTTALALFIMFFLSFYAKHKMIIGLAVVTVILLLLEKIMYGV